jgi:hypothetical protein
MQTGAQVANQAVQGILSRIDQLAAKIGTTAAHVWEVYVGQSRVEGLCDCVVAVLLIGVASVFALNVKGLWRRGVEYKNSERVDRDGNGEIHDPSGWYILSIIFGVASTILLLVSLSFVYSSIGELLNPQYWAFQHLTTDLKNLF